MSVYPSDQDESTNRKSLEWICDNASQNYHSTEEAESNRIKRPCSRYCFGWCRSASKNEYAKNSEEEENIFRDTLYQVVVLATSDDEQNNRR